MCRCRHGKKLGQGDRGIRNRVSSSAIEWVARNIQGSENNGNRNRYGIIIIIIITMTYSLTYVLTYLSTYLHIIISMIIMLTDSLRLMAQFSSTPDQLGIYHIHLLGAIRSAIRIFMAQFSSTPDRPHHYYVYFMGGIRASMEDSRLSSRPHQIDHRIIISTLWAASAPAWTIHGSVLVHTRSTKESLYLLYG